MYRTTKTAAKIVGLSAAVLVASASMANASVTVDAAGKGFVGKGDVQTALGMNNAALQKAVDAKSLVFTAQQPTTQSLSQEATQGGKQAGTQTGTQTGTQSGTQSATQVMSQDLTCTYTNGNGSKTFHRDGVRDGERSGTREGTRTGTREGSRDGDRDGTRKGTQAGVQTGSLAYDLDVDARKANQYTGFILKGWKGTPSYTETGAPVWNDAPAYGDWEFGSWSFGNYQFADGYTFDGSYDFGVYQWEPMAGVEWGEWDAAPGENPDDCLRSTNADKITQLDNVITDGAITDGATEDGAVTDGGIEDSKITAGEITKADAEYGTTTQGTPTPSGTAKVFVNSKAL